MFFGIGYELQSQLCYFVERIARFGCDTTLLLTFLYFSVEKTPTASHRSVWIKIKMRR